MNSGARIVPADRAGIRRAAQWIHRGQVVAVPTDTVYGLAAHSALAEAILKLYAIKERDRLKAIPLLIGSAVDLAGVASSVPVWAGLLAERFWPGPVTLVVPSAASVLPVLTGGAGSVAVRVPNHPVALALIESVGAPLAVTSANLSGAPETTTAAEVRLVLGDRPPLILDAGPCPGGVASTVVDTTRDPPVILRRGARVEEVERLLGQGV